MKSKVYQISWDSFLKKPEKIYPVLDKFKNNLKGKVPVKVHFGEPGNENAFRGNDIKPITDWIIKSKINGFLTDANTLYTGQRADSLSHLKVAHDHGFADLGLPINIADTEFPEFKLTKLDNQYKNLPIRLAKEIIDGENIICISHLKGHRLYGFGGALKNLGMGSALPAGKKVLHATFAGKINPEICIKCQTCLSNCPAKAILMEEDLVKINPDKCIGCGECVTVCPQGAIEVPEKNNKISQEKTAIYACGLVKKRKGLYINYLININPQCDCAASTAEILMPDLGVMISDDPVALDQASLDWINNVYGENLFEKVNGDDGFAILSMGEEIGLGKREYKIVEVD
jgi:uncharacterized protein